MPIGIGAGAAIAGIAGAGAAVTSGVINSRAAHHASDVQVNYDNQALADARAQRAREQGIQDSQRAAYDGWLNGGTIGQLRAYVNGSPGIANQPQMPGPAPLQPAPATATSTALAPQTATIAQLRAGQPPVGGAGAPAGPMGQATVTLRSPDGSERQTFAANDPKVQSYIAKGAVRIS